MQISVRTGEGVTQLTVDDKVPVNDIIPVIAKNVGHPESGTKHLVVSPTSSKTGHVVARQASLEKLMFNSSEDVLELWQHPELISVYLYFEENGNGIIRDKKIVQLDFGTPLVYMIPTIMRVLQLDNEEFVFKYCPSIEGDINCPKRWLHSGISLEEHGVEKNSCLLCYPVQKMLKKPESAINGTIRGWLLKRSLKKDRKSAKQRRLFVFSEGLLYYYRKERDLAAAGAIALEYYAISRRIQPKKKKYALLLSLSTNCFPNLTRVFKLQAENEASLENWYKALENGCINHKSHRVFGVDLKKVVRRKENQSKSVPNVVRDCVQFLRENALEKEGIFRLSACTTDVDEYKERYNSGAEVSFPGNIDHNLPAALLKCYLRELPDPLFPYSTFGAVVSIRPKDEEIAIKKLGTIILGLPIENYGTLKMIFSFLGEVLAHADTNKMTAANLATVIGPNIIRAMNDADGVQYFGVINAISELLIRKNEQLFQTAEEKDMSKKLCRASVSPLRGRGGRGYPVRGRGGRGRPMRPVSARVMSPSPEVEKQKNDELRSQFNRKNRQRGAKKFASSAELTTSSKPPLKPPTVQSEGSLPITKDKVIDKAPSTVQELQEMIKQEKHARLTLTKQIEALEQRLKQLENK